MKELEKEGDRGRSRAGGQREDNDQSWIPRVIKKRVCTTFVRGSSRDREKCQCGGRHQFRDSLPTVQSFGASVPSQWESREHTSEHPTDAFGELEFAGARCRHCPFLRLSCDTNPQLIYKLMMNNWGLPLPNLVVSIVGCKGQEKMKPWLKDVLRNGLVKAARSTGAWILAGGLRTGVSRCVGEAVRELGAVVPALSMKKVIAVGITPWGMVHNRRQLVNVQGGVPARYHIQNTSQDSYCLDKNYHAFLLVDDGSVGRWGGETDFRASLEDYISHQRTGIRGSGNIEIPVLCMLISGDIKVLERLDASLKKNTPWLVLAGSGQAADFISELLENLSSIFSAVDTEAPPGLSSEIRDSVRSKLQKHFPAQAQVEQLVDRVLSIYHNRDLITVFKGEQDGSDDFDIVLFRALVRASKRVSSDASEHIEELKLAVVWNCVDIARAELFTGTIQWEYGDLEECMTDALINDKPQFVRLFCENGLNILDYLTYGRLEALYRALPDSSLAYTLLQKRLMERLSAGSSVNEDGTHLKNIHTQPGSAMKLSLYEVSYLLSDLLDDNCKPLYYELLGLKPTIPNRKNHKHITKMLLGECNYRQKQCPYPWESLFIWAVLQNRKEMAAYFWEMAGESVLSALGGCKILRELHKHESETEKRLAMKEQAKRFESMAHDVFNECHQNNESNASTLLIRKSKVWGEATCLQMATAADARLFFSHHGVQSLLSQIWWGKMESSTSAWKLLVTFLLPPLIYANIITFRDDEEYNNSVEDRDCDVDWNESTRNHVSTSLLTEISEEKPQESLREKTRGSSSRSRKSFASQWRKFWFAPVTAFLGNVVMYIVFLCLFAYVLLVDFKRPPPDGPSTLEFVLYFWVFTLVCEEIRQTFFVGNTIVQMFRNYIQDVWNKCDLTAIALFIVGLCGRMFPASFEFGRAVMALDFLVFTLRLIHIFAVHKQLGPKIIIVGKMMKDVFFFLFFLAVWLAAYGVANQALLYSYDPRPVWIFRRVFYRPYLQIFGHLPIHEMDADKLEDIHCTNNITEIEAGEEPCINTNSNWVVVILLVIYLLFTNIVLINLLIAMFSYTFSKVQENSDIYWKFQRYNLIVEYHSRPSLAPPFIILSHIHLLIKRCIRHIPSAKIEHFALELQDNKASYLQTWEAVQKEILLSAQNKRQKETDTAQIKRTSVKVDDVLKQITDIRDRRLQQLEAEVSYCCSAIAWMTEALSQSNVIQTQRPTPQLRDFTVS
ncbi:transient receptor potential cation channel subfamily M member 4-like isoform X2 [Betta splendens]|uniref:Transient receptor potential cation channel subfamily M member 4-like isoform X2 n=1 Tax=Betta splendens TaxID=158456 RepID=A0A6P7N9A7_BETSP|nr:transient receptor potential cation channel subfamily M member 4-like isoform X2 [Betta splendens]